MLCTGDVQGCLRKLETLLRTIKYPGHVDYDSLSKGDPSAFLPIVSYTLNSFSPPFAEQLMTAGLELTGKTDLRFTDTLYKVLRDIFHYKPILTKQQFLQWGFSQRKISVTCDIISMVLQKHNQLKKPRAKCPASHKEGRRVAPPPLTDAEPLETRPFVVNHTENPSIFHTNNSAAETLSSHTPGNWIRDFEAEDEDKENTDHLSEVKGRLSALEIQMESLQSGLHRISLLEKRLDEAERWRNTEQNKGDVITVSRETWENLQSRVLLLETKLELSNTQSSAPLPCPSSGSSTSLSSMSDASKVDLNDRLQRITHMLKSTSTLLKNTESTSTPCT